MQHDLLNESVRDREEPAALSWPAFCLALGLLLCIFVFVNPIWEPNDMEAWNENILWSYLPIPFLVTFLLRFEKKFSWPAVGLETMKLTFVKFTITYALANVIWEIQGIPGTGRLQPPAVTGKGQTSYEVHMPPRANVWPAGELCDVAGTLRDEDGEPLVDALIYVRSGLEGFVFETPQSPLVFEIGSQGFAPAFAVAQTHQLIVLASGDKGLHTAVFSGANNRRRLMNLPLLPGGQRELMFDRPLEHLRLHCSVHGQAEPAAHILLLHHPHWTRTDAQGRFRLPGVPPGKLEFALQTPGHPLRLQSHELVPGSQLELSWSPTK